MPTFKNETNKPIQYFTESGNKIVIFDPAKEVGLDFWVPYSQLGLTLVSADYPPVPDSVLVCGKFKFSKGMKRIFNINPCSVYSLHIDVKKGEVMLYLGTGKNGINVNGTYTFTLNWSKVPFIRVEGLEDGTVAEIQATEAD